MCLSVDFEKYVVWYCYTIDRSSAVIVNLLCFYECSTCFQVMQMRRSKQTKHYWKTLVFLELTSAIYFCGTHQFSALMFFFCWVVFNSLHFGGRTNLAWSVCLSGKLACFEVQFKNLTSFSPPTRFFLFVKFSMSKNRLKPLERTFKRSKANWSGRKRFEVF